MNIFKKEPQPIVSDQKFILVDGKHDQKYGLTFLEAKHTEAIWKPRKFTETKIK